MKGPGGRGEVEVAVSGVIGTVPFLFFIGCTKYSSFIQEFEEGRDNYTNIL